MGPLIPSGDRLRRLLTLITLSVCSAYAQAPPVAGRCDVTAVPNQVRLEGLTEPMGDILLQCSGSTPGAVLTGNLSVNLPVSITNRIDANNRTTDAVLAVDYGMGFVPTGVAGQISNQIIAFNGLSITVPPSGAFSLRIRNIRAAVYQLGGALVQPIQAQLIFSTPVSVVVNQSQLNVAYLQRGLYSTLYDRGNIYCAGSPLPETVTLSDLFAAGTTFASTRLTEGFASAFQPRGPGEDNGIRIFVKYSGFPAGARLFVPDLIAGSGATAPTSGGDLGLPRQVGQYTPGSGALLLVRVAFADESGAGGFPVAVPTGSGPVTLNSAGEVPLRNGAGFAVYEVAVANPAELETAQFPTFVGLPVVNEAAVAQESVSFAPAGTGLTASTTAPVPRFAALPPSSDCNILGDCGGPYFPRLNVIPNPIRLTAIAGGAMTSQPGYIPINNDGGGILNWAAIVNYERGAGWLTLDRPVGQNNASIRIWANPQGLTAGIYNAGILIDAGMGGTVSVPLTLTVFPAPAVPEPNPPSSGPTASPVTVTKVVNAATYEVTPMVAGSLSTLMGSNLAGSNVSVTFDGFTAPLLYTSETQINLLVPGELIGKSTATVVVHVEGVNSAPQIVPLAPAWPAIFRNGVLNQDNSPNSALRAARPGTILQIFATGIPAGAAVSAVIGGRHDLVPLYAGPAPDVPGVQQVNVAIPGDLAAGPTQLALCVTAAGQQYCSTAFPLAVQ